jgi:hypothetical protein
VNFRSTRACPICNRPACATEHLSADLSPQALQEIHDLLEHGVRPAIADAAVATEVSNFISMLRTSLQHWEAPADNSDLLG